MIANLALKVARERQIRIYKKLYAAHKESHRALHWSNIENQKKRFDILLEVGDISNKKILDIGSGMGDFFGHINDKELKADMTGYEVVEEFIAISKKKYPKYAFKSIDLSRSISHEKFDYVFSSGIYAFGNRTFFETMLNKAFKASKIAYAFNIYNPQRDSRFMDISEAEIEKVITALKPSRVVHKRGYLENDMTFFVYK